MIDWLLKSGLHKKQVEVDRSESDSRISKVIWDWPKDEPFRVATALERYPELAEDSRAIIEFAVEEFADRKDSGEDLSATTFAHQFPLVRTQLLDSLVVDQGFREHSDWVQSILSRQPEPYDWPAVGEVVGGYKLLEPLGSGGFSRVYVAEDPKVRDRKVAVKLCRQETQEADNLANLNHRTIGVVYDVTRDKERDLGVIAMQYRSRTTLHKIIRHLWNGRRPVAAGTVWNVIAEVNSLDAKAPDWSQAGYTDWVLDLAIELARGLEESHGNGIVHCDLKPANVLVDREGRPILVDFNVALNPEKATSAGNVGGTLPYMAPEQIRSFAGRGFGDLGPATDLFGLAATLYELLPGKLPFGTVKLPFGTVKSAEDGIRALLSVRKAPPRPIRQWNPDVDLEFERVLLDCLNYESAERPQSAGQVADALEGIRTRRMVAKAEHGQRKMSRWGSGAAVVTLGVIIGIGTLETPNNELVPQPAAVPALADQVKEGYQLLNNDNYEAAADRFSAILDQEPGHRAAVIGLCRAKVQMQRPAGAAKQVENLINGRPTAELASLIGYLYAVNGDFRDAVTMLNYARKQGGDSDALLLNLAYAESNLGNMKDQGPLKRATLLLQMLRQRNGDEAKSNVLQCIVMENAGEPNLKKHLALLDACPKTSLTMLWRAHFVVIDGRKKFRRDRDAANIRFQEAVACLKAACDMGADLRHWNSLKTHLPEEIIAQHEEYFSDAGDRLIFPDRRKMTQDPFEGWDVKAIKAAAVDGLGQPVTLAGN